MDKLEISSGVSMSFNEREKLIRSLLTDFLLANSWSIQKELHNLPERDVAPIGLKILDFIDYEDRKGTFERPLMDYLIYILKYIKILCNKNLLTSIPSFGLPWLEEKYTSILTPQNDEYWSKITAYADILGLEYIYSKIRKYEVHIEVKNTEGDYHGGSGTLIAPGVILTCRHVVDPDKFEISKIELNNSIYEVKGIKLSEEKDIGLVYIQGCDVDPRNNIIFGKGNVLEEIITFGYPTIPMLREAPMIAQKGEINAVTTDFEKNKCLIISSIVRPGNSGGAIISENGLFVGMVSDFKERHTISEKLILDSTQTLEQQLDSICNHINTMPQLVPFYSGIASEEIIDEIHKIDKDLIIAIDK